MFFNMCGMRNDKCGRQVFVAVFLFALLIRVTMVAIRPPDSTITLTPLNDSTDYHHLALSILHLSYSSPTGKPTAFRAPVYPLFLAIIYLISGKGNLIAVAVCQALLGAASVWLIARIAFLLWRNFWCVLFAGGIASLYPAFVFQTPLILTEVLHRFLQLLFLFVLLKAIKQKSISLMFFAGLLAGISILSKSVLLITFPLLCIWVWLVFRSTRILRRWGLGGFALGALLVLTPWTTRNFLVSGKFIPVSTNFPITFAQGVTRFSFYTNKWFGSAQCMPVEDDFLHLTQLRYYDGIKEELAIGKLYATQALNFIAQHPLFYIWLTIRKFLHFWSPFIRNTLLYQLIAFFSMTPVLLFGWFGILYTLIKRPAEKQYAILALIIALPTSLIYAISQPDIRYRLSIIDPLWIIFAANFFCSLFSFYKKFSCESLNL